MPVHLVQDALLSREENKQGNGLKTSQGIYGIGKAVLSFCFVVLSEWFLVFRSGFSLVDYFFFSGEGGSCPAFEAGESLAGTDSLEASSTGSSIMTCGCNLGSAFLSDARLVRVL